MRKRIFSSEKQHSRVDPKTKKRHSRQHHPKPNCTSLSLAVLFNLVVEAADQACAFLLGCICMQNLIPTPVLFASFCLLLISWHQTARLNTRVSISLSLSLILHLHTFVAIYNIRRVKEQMGSLLTKSISKEQLEMAVSKVKTIVNSNPVVVFRFFYCSF